MNILSTQTPRRLSALATVVAGLLLAAGQAQANTAATAVIRNVVTVNYANAAGQAASPQTASVDVSVELVGAAPTLEQLTPNQTIDSSATAIYSYRVTNNANGPLTLSLSTSVGTLTNLSGASASLSATTSANTTLGATTSYSAFSIPTTGTVTVTVPRDQAANNSLNGLETGDTVVVVNAGTPYYLTVGTVNAANDVVTDAGAAGATAAGATTTIVLTPVTYPGSVVAIGAGVLIAETKTFNMTVDPATVTTPENTASVVVSTTATVAGVGPVYNGSASDDSTTTIEGLALSVRKLVRNASQPSMTGTGSESHCGVTAYAGGITGKATERLEYIIVVSNTSTTSSASQIRVSDPVPPFTALDTASLEIDADGDGGSPFASLNAADSNGDAGEADSSSVYFYPGTGGTDGAAGLGNGTGGSLPANSKVCMKFQVTIQ